VGRFAEVAHLLREKNAGEAFARAAELCLERYELLKDEIGAAATLKFAIEFHKHALFCEVAADKTRSQHDAAAFAAYQTYLAGETDIPVAVGLPASLPPDTNANVDLDNTEGDGHGEEDDE
jgi:hypothetical protein